MTEEHAERDEDPHWGAWAAEPGIDGWIRDRDGDYTETEMQAVAKSRVVQLRCAPEPHPGERVSSGSCASSLRDGAIPDLRAKKVPHVLSKSVELAVSDAWTTFGSALALCRDYVFK